MIMVLNFNFKQCALNVRKVTTTMIMLFIRKKKEAQMNTKKVTIRID